MADREQLKRLKEIIEKGSSPEEEAENEKKRIQKVNEIVERLIKRDQKIAQPTSPATLKLKTQIEGTAAPAIDFGKLRFDRSTDDKVRAIGRFYNAFKGPVLVIASFFANLPAAGELHSNLKAGSINVRADEYIIISSTASFVAALCAIVLAYLSATAAGEGNALNAASLSVFVGTLVFFLCGVGAVVYPALRADSRATQVDRELPFALRQLATQIRSGVSFQRAFLSVAQADYGVLSKEIRITLGDMERGRPADEALMDLHDRTRSHGLRQAIMQIIRTLRTGGALADIISGIADDVSFETRMRVRDFTEQLNLINVIFIMIAVVAPVVLTIFVSVMQLPLLGSGVSQPAITAGFIGIIVAMAGVILFIKKIEPISG